MAFYNRLVAANVSSTALALIPANLQQARLLARNFELYGDGVISACLYESCDAQTMRRGADAFALWLAVSRFVATCYPGRNRRGSLIGQCESSLILLAQLLVGQKSKHPALAGIEVHNFMEAVRDAFDAFAIDLTLTVSHDNDTLFGDAYIDDGDELGGCSTGSGIKARGEKLMDTQFCHALFTRCSQVAHKPIIERRLFERITVDEGDWNALLKAMTTEPAKPATRRQPKPIVPRPIFADLPA